MSWTPCYEVTSEADAQLVCEFLEGNGVPCRVEPMGASVFPSLGFEVLVPSDRLEDALGLVDTAFSVAGDATAAPAWDCEHCGEVVADQLDACWSCGASRDGDTPIPIERISFPPAVDDRKLHVFRAVETALRLVAAHPTILVAAIPLLVGEGIAIALGIPETASLASANLGWSEYAVVLLDHLALQPLAVGLAIAFADRASRGPASWPESVRHLVPKLPALIALTVVLPIPELVEAMLERRFGIEPHLAIVIPYALVQLWLVTRFALLEVSIVVDDDGPLKAFQRSWTLTSGNWWRTFLLLVLGGVAVASLAWLPRPVRGVLSCLLTPVMQAVLVMAYRQLAVPRDLDRSVTDPLHPLAVLPA